MKFLPDLPIELDPPKAPLRGNLVLTGGQERALTRHFLERLRSVQGSYVSDDWLEKRNMSMRHFASNMEDRRRPGTIFEKSNMSLNLPKRYVRITASRVYDELLTANPMMSVTVEGKDDNYEDARVIERYCAFKLDQAKIRLVLRESETLAAIRGETVVKTTWKRKTQRYYRTAVVLIGPDGEPVRGRDGNPVLQTDAFTDTENGDKILTRDPRVVLTGTPTWEERRVDMRRVLYNNIESACLDHRDFFCNATESDVHKADFCAIKLDFGLDEVKAMLAPLEGQEDADTFISKLENSLLDGKNKAEANRPDRWRGETERHRDAIPQCPFAEVYARVILDEDGQADEIAALIDLENEQLLTYDYLDNISPTGRRPFRVVRMEPVPHRWYGTGFYELFSDRHKFCDLYMNRVNLASSLSGNIKIENPMATEEGLAGEPIEFGTTKTYRLRDGYSADDVFKVIPIPNDSGSSENLLNMLMQVTQLEAGIVSAGDHGMAGLPAAGLATGIKSLDRVANVLLKNILADFISGFEDILADSVALIMTYYDDADAEMLMGPEAAATLSKFREISQLPYKVKLEVSTSRDAEVIENHTRAFEMLMQFEQIPPEARLRLRPVLMRILTVMGIEDVDKALSDDLALPSMGAGDAPTEEAMDQMAEAGQPQVQQGPVGDRDTPDVNAIQV
jgi:hypothetical protein